jgi:hypothetical protein
VFEEVDGSLSGNWRRDFIVSRVVWRFEGLQKRSKTV